MTSRYIIHNPVDDNIVPLPAVPSLMRNWQRKFQMTQTCKYCTETNDKKVLLKHGILMRARLAHGYVNTNST